MFVIVQCNNICSRMHPVVCNYKKLHVHTSYLLMHIHMYMRGSAIFLLASKMVQHAPANIPV
ncbi:hypothetical protein FBX97_5160 [Herbaspirillum sp. SJZ107]|nr:hypothetical protein FBX97_5160 [Herbaspirillum sp. SJZ107]